MLTEGAKPNILVETEVEGEFESLEFNESLEKKDTGAVDESMSGVAETTSVPVASGSDQEPGSQGAPATVQPGPEDEALKEFAATATKVNVLMDSGDCATAA